MDIENMVNEVQALDPMEPIDETKESEKKFMSKVAVSRS